MNKFVVVDETGNVSYGLLDKRDAEPEGFGTKQQAEKRAVALAKCAPGASIGVYQLISTTTAEVASPVTKRVKEE